MPKKAGLGKVKKTSRGFQIVTFKDRYGVKCSLQKSSLVDPSIWLGCEDPDPVVFDAGSGTWNAVPLPKEAVCNTRMHLNRRQVEKLVESLQRWLDTESFR